MVERVALSPVRPHAVAAASEDRVRTATATTCGKGVSVEVHVLKFDGWRGLKVGWFDGWMV